MVVERRDQETDVAGRTAGLDQGGVSPSPALGDPMDVALPLDDLDRNGLHVEELGEGGPSGEIGEFGQVPDVGDVGVFGQVGNVEVVGEIGLGGVGDPALELGPPRLEDQFVDVEHVARYGTLEQLVDGFVDAYNAHDLDTLLELLSEDVELPEMGIDIEGFPVAVTTMWEEHPNAVLTRGLLGEQPVTVLWDVAEAGAWTRVAVLTFELADDDGQLGLVELLEDATLVESAEADEPEPDLAEGARWEEWYEGEDGDFPTG